ncbi:MAG: AbrB/MazE/SpoVT family DNA-binding domain-containing protein [Planctomycetota bacterium]
MGNALKTHLIAIGNSRGVRIPKLWLDQLALGPNIEVVLQRNQLVIRSAKPPRAGWAAQFKKMAERGDAELLDPPTATQFDKDEWEW